MQDMFQGAGSSLEMWERPGCSFCIRSDRHGPALP